MRLTSTPLDKNVCEPKTFMSKEQVQFIQDAWHDFMLLFRKPKQQPSLLAEGVNWCNSVGFVPRLEAIGQLDCWLSHKHIDHENE